MAIKLRVVCGLGYLGAILLGFWISTSINHALFVRHVYVDGYSIETLGHWRADALIRDGRRITEETVIAGRYVTEGAWPIVYNLYFWPFGLAAAVYWACRGRVVGASLLA